MFRTIAILVFMFETYVIKARCQRSGCKIFSGGNLLSFAADAGILP
jgi:hypothetical protein